MDSIIKIMFYFFFFFLLLLRTTFINEYACILNEKIGVCSYRKSILLSDELSIVLFCLVCSRKFAFTRENVNEVIRPLLCCCCRIGVIFSMCVIRNLSQSIERTCSQYNSSFVSLRW